MMQNYEKRLRDATIKVTPQRMAIVELLDGHVHMSVEELYGTIKERFPSISLATVYKNINVMLEKGFLFEVKVPGQKSKYELTKYPHSHVVCQSCGKVEDVVLDLKHISHEAANKSRYEIRGNALILSGLCPECKAS